MTTRASDVRRDAVIDDDRHTEASNLHDVETWPAIREKRPVDRHTRLGGYWMVTDCEGVVQVARYGETFAHKIRAERSRRH